MKFIGIILFVSCVFCQNVFANQLTEIWIHKQYLAKVEYCDQPCIYYWWIGEGYANGCGVKKDINKAFYYYQKAIEEPYIDKCIGRFGFVYCTLADCYYYGRGTEVSYEKALALYKKCLLLTYDPKAMMQISKCFRFGRGVVQNNDSADLYLKMATEFGEENAVKLSDIERTGKRLEDAELISLLKKYAEKGDVRAMCYLANNCHIAEEEKIMYLKVVAAKGYGIAYEYLAFLLQESGGRYSVYTEEGIKDLEQYVKQAYRAGFNECCKLMAKAYKRGIYSSKKKRVIPNYTKCRYWSELVRCEFTYNYLYELYDRGLSCRKDNDKAFDYLSKAAQMGTNEHDYSIELLNRDRIIEASYLWVGSCMDLTIYKFLNIDKLIANQDTNLFFYGYHYYSENNMELAVSFFSRALETSLRKYALLMLAVCYQNGEGVSEDIVLSEKYRKEAESIPHIDSMNEVYNEIMLLL